MSAAVAGLNLDGAEQLTFDSLPDGAFRGVQVSGGAEDSERIITPDGTAVTRTRNPAAAADDPNPWRTTVYTAGKEIDGANIGLALGSSIGQALGGSNPFARVAAGTVLGALLQNVGQAFGRSLDQNIDMETAFEQVAPELGANLVSAFRSQAVGAVSSFLTGELMDSLNVGNSFGGQLLRSVTGTVTSRVLDNAVSMAQQAASASGEVTTGLFDGLTSAAGVVNIAGSVGNFLGGSIGSSMGGAVGGATCARGYPPLAFSDQGHVPGPALRNEHGGCGSAVNDNDAWTSTTVAA